MELVNNDRHLLLVANSHKNITTISNILVFERRIHAHVYKKRALFAIFSSSNANFTSLSNKRIAFVVNVCTVKKCFTSSLKIG